MTDTTATSATTTDAAAEDAALKAKHRAMWASGDYPALASELIWALGPAVVDAVDVRPGERVIDIAAGTGNVAIRAALRGATVVATDLTPELFDAGRRLATEAGAELEWRQADAEALPFADGEFDVAVSSVGVMFAPHHERAASELVRVVRPGGRIGVLNWTPDGFIGRVFGVMKPYAAPLPPGATPAPRWGDEAHVRELLGDAVDDVVVRRASVEIDRFTRPEEFRDYFKSHYGPTIAVYARIAGDPAQVEALDQALVDLVREHGVDGSGGTMRWEYLLVTARRREA
jgi:ubiquinone/menaquinone biosynthesis C-methylase UbiE